MYGVKDREWQKQVKKSIDGSFIICPEHWTRPRINIVILKGIYVKAVYEKVFTLGLTIALYTCSQIIE